MKTFFYLVCATLLLSASTMSAQAPDPFWRQLDQPYGGDIFYFMTAPNGELFTGMERGGMFRSSDEGATWRRFGPEGSGGYPILVTTQGSIFVFTGDEGDIVRSTDDGQTWAQTAEGALNVESGVMIQTSNGDILMASDSGLFRSTNNGAHWDHIGLDSMFLRFPAVAPDGTIFVATNNDGLFRSTDNGATWMSVGTMQDHPVDAIVFLGSGGLVVGTDDGVYRSADNGNSFTPFALAGERIGPFALKRLPDGSYLTCARDSGLIRIAQDGSTTNLHAPPGRLSGLEITASNKILIGYNGRGIVRSSDGGLSYQSVGLAHGMNVKVIAEGPGRTMFAGGDASLFGTSDGGATWSDLHPPDVEVEHIAVTPSGTMFITGYQHYIYRSTNLGATWKQLDSGLNLSQSITGVIITKAGSIVISSDAGIIRSTDNGDTWTSIISGEHVESMGMSPNGDLWSIGYRTLHHSTDDGATWDMKEPMIPTQHGFEPLTIVAPDNNTLVVSGTDLTPPRIAYSTNKGVAWDTVSLPCDDYNMTLVEGLWGNLFVRSSCGILRSTDRGATWSQFAPLPDNETRGVFFADSRGDVWYGGTYGVYTSTAVLGVPNNGIIVESTTSLRAFPNPTRDAATVSFTLHGREHVVLSLVNLMGQTVATITDASMDAGDHSMQVDFDRLIGHELPNGAYIVRLSVGGRVESTSLRLVR